MTTVCEKKSHLGLNLLNVDLLLSAQLQHLRTEQQVTVHVQYRYCGAGGGGGGQYFSRAGHYGRLQLQPLAQTTENVLKI